MIGEPRQNPLLGIALVVAAASCFAMMDTTVRYIGAFFSVAIVLWMRYALHALAMSIWIALSPDKTFRSANPMFQIARGARLPGRGADQVNVGPREAAAGQHLQRSR